MWEIRARTITQQVDERKVDREGTKSIDKPNLSMERGEARDRDWFWFGDSSDSGLRGTGERRLRISIS